MKNSRKNAVITAVCAVVLGLLAGSGEAQAQKKSRFRDGYEVRGSRPGRSSKKKATRSASRPSARPRYSSSVVVPREHNVVREDGRNVVYKKRNVVDFDDSLIEGEVKNPSEFYFVHRPEEKFGSLVKKRKNFHKEMLRDSVMIR